MSTRVYNAYKLSKRVKFWDLVRAASEQGSAAAVQKLNSKHWWLMRSINNQSESFLNKVAELEKRYAEKTPDQIQNIARVEYAFDLMTTGYKESIRTHHRSPFNFDASVTFRELDGYVYMQLFAQDGMHGIFDFLITWPGVKDYHYQNSSDRPEEISAQDWRERRRVWDRLYAKDTGRKTFLSLTILDLVEFNRWALLTRWDIAEARQKSIKTS